MDCDTPGVADEAEGAQYRPCAVCGPIIGEGNAAIDTTVSRFWPIECMVEVDGAYYCQFHYGLKFPKRYLDEEVIDTSGEQELQS